MATSRRPSPTTKRASERRSKPCVPAPPATPRSPPRRCEIRSALREAHSQSGCGRVSKMATSRRPSPTTKRSPTRFREALQLALRASTTPPLPLATPRSSECARRWRYDAQMRPPPTSRVSLRRATRTGQSAGPPPARFVHQGLPEGDNATGAAPLEVHLGVASTPGRRRLRPDKGHIQPPPQPPSQDRRHALVQLLPRSEGRAPSQGSVSRARASLPDGMRGIDQNAEEAFGGDACDAFQPAQHPSNDREEADRTGAHRTREVP